MHLALAVDVLLDGEAEKLTRKAVELALAGDTVALRLCMERVCPPRRDRPVKIRMARIEAPQDVLGAIATVVSLDGGWTLSSAPDRTADAS